MFFLSFWLAGCSVASQSEAKFENSWQLTWFSYGNFSVTKAPGPADSCWQQRSVQFNITETLITLQGQAELAFMLSQWIHVSDYNMLEVKYLHLNQKLYFESLYSFPYDFNG